MTTATDGARLEARRAVEALRSGVPSAAAVRALGSGQPALEARFRELLETSKSAARTGRQSAGLLFGGGFGEGKSHLLSFFEHLALRAGFASSRVVISKETPLHDPTKLLASAVESLRTPDRVGRGLEEAAIELRKRRGSPEYVVLEEALAADGAFNSRFPATLEVYERSGSEPDVSDRIVRFWSGDKLGVTELRRWLRELGRGQAHALTAIRARELALQTFSFVPLLLRAAGLHGWVLLIDEVELIGQYTPLQRGRAYAELARWLGSGDEERPGLATVAALTNDFVPAVLVEKGDQDRIGPLLEARDPEVARLAERGMRLIRAAELLAPVGDEVRQRTYATLRQLHGRAYAWSPPDVAWPEALGTTAMRTYVRAWINAWDVRRLYPEVEAPEYEIERITTDYGEQAAIEEPARDAAEPGSDGAPPPDPADDW